MISQNFLKKSAVFVLFFLSINLYANTDIQNYSDKQKERLYKKGKKIYENVCSKVNVDTYESFKHIKKDIKENSTCGKQREKNITAVSFYLWSLKNSTNSIISSEQMQIPKGSKCPVCGMFVHKYPKWAAKIQIGKHTHYFDGVKDMMKFYFYPNSFGHKHNNSYKKQIKVSDYYTLKQIDAKKAWYVMGSNVYGPMGHELIPFRTKKEAQTFLKNHYGQRVLNFSELSEELVFGLDK